MYSLSCPLPSRWIVHGWSGLYKAIYLLVETLEHDSFYIYSLVTAPCLTVTTLDMLESFVMSLLHVSW